MELTATNPSAPIDSPHLSSPDHLITLLSAGTMAQLGASMQIVISDIVQTDHNSYYLLYCQGKWEPTHPLF